MRPVTCASVLVMAAVIATLLAPMHVSADDELSNGTVTPTEGTTATTFVFSVDYNGSPGDIPSVTARIGDVVVSMALESGLPHSGTYVGSSTLPAGSWQVTFHAQNVQGPSANLPGPLITVRDDAPTPPPTPVPTPTPTPTPRPTPAPTPVPTATPSPSPTPTPRETPGGSVFSPSPTPTDEPSASATPEPDLEPTNGERIGFGPLVMLFIGGTMAGSGAAFLGVHWLSVREKNALSQRPPVPHSRP